MPQRHRVLLPFYLCLCISLLALRHLVFIHRHHDADTFIHFPRALRTGDLEPSV
jgi:hypothetical protein